MPCSSWLQGVRLWVLVGLLHSCVLCLPTPAHGAVFVWALEFGSDFSLLKNGLRLDRKPPQFDRDLLGTSLSFRALGVLHVNNWFELYGSFDMGELFVGQQSRAGQGQFVVLLNQIQLNAMGEQRQAIEQAEALCRQRALHQGVPISDCYFYSPALAESLFLRELFFRVSLHPKHWMRLDIGFRERTIGRGYLFDDYALGFFWQADLTKREGTGRLPLKIEVDLFLSDTSFTPEAKQSPVLSASIAYVPKKDQELRFFATYMYDGDRLAAKAILPMWQDLIATRINGVAREQAGVSTQYFCRNILTEQEYLALQGVSTPDGSMSLLDTYSHTCSVMPQSHGHHLWFGLQGQGQFGKLLLEGVAMVYLAGYQMAIPDVILGAVKVRFDAPRDVDVFGVGMVAEIKATLRWTPSWSTGLYFLAISGDHFEPDRGVYYTFVGITPQSKYTELFFNGGINAYSYRQGLGISSVAGKGVLALGTTVQYKANSSVEMRLNASALWSVVPSTFSTLKVTVSGQYYGTEFNFAGNYALTRWLRLAIKADLLFPGNFFAIVRPPPVVFQMRGGLVVSLDG